MTEISLTSKLLHFAGAGSRKLYTGWRIKSAIKEVMVYSQVNTDKLLNLQSVHGYNDHSLVSISSSQQSWIDEQTFGGISFTQQANVWLVAGETLASEENLLRSTERFLLFARKNKKIAAFLPVSERFAKIVTAGTDLQAVKIGASPYFDLQNWNPRGNKAKGMRAGLSQARRNNLKIEEVSEINETFQKEVDLLCQKWNALKCSFVKFGWLFELDPFKNADKKKYFTARDTEGELVGLLVASPIPAREGWYLEDVLRSPDAPNGTADLLVFETLKMLSLQGAKLATLGTVPLSQDGEDIFSSKDHYLTKELMNFSRKYFNSLYNFQGLRHFKAKFVPTWWESQYILVPKGWSVPPRVLKAFLFTIMHGKN